MPKVRGRYAILTHDHPFLHWDLMLEEAGTLRTWRLLSSPTPDQEISAESLPDHRLHYLDYEGPVSGDRGRVIRWDRGHFWGDLTSQRIECEIHGDRLCGVFVLVEAGGGRWAFCYHPATPSGNQ